MVQFADERKEKNEMKRQGEREEERERKFRVHLFCSVREAPWDIETIRGARNKGRRLEKGW